MKEKWYLWSGKGNLPSGHAKVLLRNGSIEGFTRNKIMWRQRKFYNEGFHIIAYTKGEMIN